MEVSGREHAVTASELLQGVDVFIERAPARDVHANSEWIVELAIAHALTAIALEATAPEPEVAS